MSVKRYIANIPCRTSSGVLTVIRHVFLKNVDKTVTQQFFILRNIESLGAGI